MQQTNIAKLRTEALAQGDYDQAALCDLALEGEIDPDDYTCVSDRMARRLRGMTAADARVICEDVIRYGRN